MWGGVEPTHGKFTLLIFFSFMKGSVIGEPLHLIRLVVPSHVTIESSHVTIQSNHVTAMDSTTNSACDIHSVLINGNTVPIVSILLTR